MIPEYYDEPQPPGPDPLDVRKAAIEDQMNNDANARASKRYAAVIRVHIRVSADYETEARQYVMALDPETTIGEIVKWSERFKSDMGQSDITICEAA